MKRTPSLILLLLAVQYVFGKTDLNPTPLSKVNEKKTLNNTLSNKDAQNQERVSVIVVFNEEPLFIREAKNKSFKKSASFYRQRFSEFSTVIGVPVLAKTMLNKSSVGITHEYYKTFFGVRLVIASGKLSQITTLPYVKAVHYNRKVKATLEKSVLQIGANKIWETFGNQGEGIKVGIIDSGIDYMHPALGGGIGASFKVAGGYDFVNLDNDPMDDAGHGTHVAGIVSANSADLKGVAPKSTLYAYKVLDENGSGEESDVISAIERVVDPNDDGDMADKLDVVNLSLGSERGNPNDASSIAVNNASKLGVVFVIAAGNSGHGISVPGKENNYYFNGSGTIGSPGTAELAITVGAVDSVDQLANFSSKGPNKMTFGIKPEVVAPGVKINSTFLGQTRDILNGTSMATPMVAGVAALLKSLHPHWSVERIKSVIVNTAKDIGLGAYKQGGGRVQALKAASGASWITPSILNLGLDNPSVSTWVRKDTLYVYNGKNTSQNYTTSISGLQSGITINIAPSNFSVSSGGSTQVVVTTTVDNSTIGIVADDIPLYSGRIKISGDSDTLHIPWAFARANRLILTFNEVKPFFLGTSATYAIYGSDYNSVVGWVSPTMAEIYGFKKGTYDFFVSFSSPEKSKIVIKESVLLNTDNAVLNISSSEATVPLVYQSKDHNGNPLSSYPATRKVLQVGIPQWGEQTVSMMQLSDTVLVSPASTRYTFRPMEYHFNPNISKSFHIAQYSTFTGLSAAKNFMNNQADYISQNFRFVFPQHTQQAMLLGEFFAYKTEQDTLGYVSGIGYDFDTVSVTNSEYTFKGYFQRSLEPLKDAAVGFYSISNLQTGLIDLSTFPVMLCHDSVIAITKENVMATVPRSPDGGTISFGEAPVHVMTLWYNNVFGGNSLHFRTLFRGAHRERRDGDVIGGTYSVYDKNGALVFTNPLDVMRDPEELTAERYTVVLNSSNFWLRNKKGKIQQRAEFDLSKSPANPPSLTSLAVLNQQGQPVNALVKGEHGSLLFSAEVINFSSESQVHPDSTKVWYRIHGTTEWSTLPVEVIAIAPGKDGTVFKSNLASALETDSVAIDLRVFVKNADGFSNEFQIEPAFAVGNWLGSDPTDIEDPVTNVPKTFVLHQNFPNPFNPSTTIRFGLPRQSSVQVEIFNLLGQRIEMLDKGILSAGYHHVQWRANVPSGVYFYRVVTAPASGGAKSVSQTKKMLLLR